MRSPIVAVANVALLALAAGPIAAQAAASPRIHWYLEQRLDAARPGDKLPVYFVMADQLGHDHWFPRVDLMHVDERRRFVVGELRAHAERTQRGLLARLREHEAAGSVSRIRSLWIANLVKCDATPEVVRRLADLPGLREVRHDASWPLALVEDGAPSAPGATASNGPINTRADLVWALGFTGQGVVAMNVDTVAAINHGDLVGRKWTNTGEIPNNGIDDDHNGYVDDVHGYNFFDDNNNISVGSTSHGTMTAGVMVADGACSGTITGQAPGARVMYGAVGGCCPQNGPVNPAGEVAQWEAVQYGIDNGAHVQTSSHSYKNGFVPPPNYAMHRTVGDNSLAAGLIRCNSVSNNGAVANQPGNFARIPFNVSAPGNLPCPYIDPNQTLVGGRSGVVGVGAHDVSSNQLMSYSPRGPYAWHLDDLLVVNESYPRASWSMAHNDYPWFGGTRQGLLKPDLTGPTNTLSPTGSACGLGPVSGTSNATPRVAGTMILWKGANPSLKPEDTAMIAHQTATSTGILSGKESSWGAGRVDAYAGLQLALCVHRIDGQPAWSVDHQAGQNLTVELDGIPRRQAVLAIATERRPGPTWGGVLGLGGSVHVFWSGLTGESGDVSLSLPVPAALAGRSVFTQGFLDGAGVVGTILSSNVIETRFVPPRP